MHADEHEMSTDGWPTVPRRVLRGIAATLIAGGILTVLTIVIPHDNTTHDGGFLAVGMAFLLFGVALRVWSRREDVGLASVHATSVLVTLGVLALTWYGMVDVAGLQAVFLLIPLAISASFGPLRWSLTLLVLQSGGYALVLATADRSLGLDRATQWTVITAGLMVGLLYHDLMRRQIAAATLHEAAVRAERSANREAHARRLQLLNEELASANELKDRFVAMASHELRTPLTSISGFSMTMVDRWESLADADKLRFVRIIEEQSDRLGRLVSDLLTLSRIEDGRIETDATPLQLAPIIHRTIDHLGTSDVVVHCPADIQVAASADHVEQVLVNLLGNAVNYGGSRVEVSASSDVASGSIIIVVADDGRGVDPAFVPQLFRRFTRASEHGTATDHVSGGSGLGLSIVEGLSTAYGGDAWYEPNEPDGSRFCVRLPSHPTVS